MWRHGADTWRESRSGRPPHVPLGIDQDGITYLHLHQFSILISPLLRTVSPSFTVLLLKVLLQALCVSRTSLIEQRYRLKDPSSLIPHPTPQCALCAVAATGLLARNLSLGP